MVCALAAALCACGGTQNDNTTSSVDFFNVTIYGAPMSYTDASAGVALLAMSGVSANTVVSLMLTGVNVQLSIPAGQTGAVSGSFSSIVGGNSCSGTVAVNVTKHGTALGGEVAATFGPTSISCPIGPSPQTVSGSFSVTHL
jgi:hypothetical protein